jgi:uncharacterized protein YjdB
VAACSDKEEIGGGSATVEVIGNPVTGLSISNAADNRIILTEVGSTVTAQVTATPSNADDAGNYTFTSSDVKIFTVTGDGLITATGYGEATLSVVNQNDRNVSAQCKVLVVGTRVESLTIDPAYQDYEITRTNADGPVVELAPNITVSPSNASVKTLKYTSSNPEVAIVSDDGTIFALWEGTTVIKAEAIDGSGKFAECNLTVSITPVTTITFNSPAATTPYYQFSLNDRDNRNYNHDGPSSEAKLYDYELTKGTAATSPVQYQPSNATRNTLQYESLNPAVLVAEANTGNNYLMLTPVSAGTATIRASATDGYNAFGEQVFKVHHMLDQTNWTVVDASAHGTKTGSGTGDTSVEKWDIEEALHGGVGTLLKPSAPLVTDTEGTVLPNRTDSAYFVINMQAPTTFDYFSVQWNRSMETGSRVRYFSLHGSNDGTTFTFLQRIDKGSNWQYRTVLNKAYTYQYIKVKVINATSYNYNATGSGNALINYWHICNLNFGVLP